MDTQHKITICMGSSCFARGNEKTLGIIKTYIQRNGLNAQIDFRGKLCSNMCNKGPVIYINDTCFESVDPDSVTDILDSVFVKG
ncbi:MAG: (2Fe-2S) ferredoxin domain-containing protein [Bacteroidales bacterium]|nr:(2Fe-2S) ferredoxin domain-containing protein [Bacteroidales bacterium]